ncbi:MAG TPA: hypothetical protein VFV10_12415 [Gammaproteobacteria bacterium]|nr:hypothetical protein [Gammaproteobacteria bacterium]
MVREIDADRETPKEVQARIKTMLTFLTSLMTWFDQIVQLPKGTLVALMKLGAKVGALVPKPVPLVVSFWALDASRMRAEGLTASAATPSLVVGGVLGFVGLVRSYRTAPEAGPGGIELTIVFLLAGIAAALAPIAGVASAFGGQAPLEAVKVAAACVAVPLTVLIVAALGAIQRITREYAARAGKPFDPLPVLFLSVALALIVCTAVVASTLSHGAA